MRISLVSDGDAGRDATARRTSWSLAHVGHEVTTVHLRPRPDHWEGAVEEVPAVVPTGLGTLGAAIRRMQPEPSRRSSRRWRLARRLTRTDPDIVYPVARRDLDIAVAGRGRGWVSTPPEWQVSPADDLAEAAPVHRAASTSPAGPGVDHHYPGWAPGGPPPVADRHTGTTVVMAYRQTSTTPARYLAAAMERAGIAVSRVGTDLSWDDVPDDAAAVVVVESPLPEVRVTGRRKPIPLLFWVHHGEHHLATNLRLLDRYRADAVLLAHSWHLAHRFPVPVHRFPFGVAPELYPSPVPFIDRPFDVSMVGAGLATAGGRYDRRSRMVADLIRRFGERAHFPDRVTPEELAAIYAGSKVVVNDGGFRHRPITMRVFEAIGAGAMLLTEDLPGTDVLFPDDQYEAMSDDPVSQVEALLSDRATPSRAAAAHLHAMDVHTYDRRVDELLVIAAQTRPVDRAPADEPTDPLLARIHADVDVDSLLVMGEIDDLVASMPDRVVWSFADRAKRSELGTYDGTVIVEPVDGAVDAAVAAARRVVYGIGAGGTAIKNRIADAAPSAEVTEEDGVVRIDLGFVGGYRQRSDHEGTSR